MHSNMPMIEPSLIEFSVALLVDASRSENSASALSHAHPKSDLRRPRGAEGIEASSDWMEAIQGFHLRAARALLDWPMTVLAESSSVSISTVKRLEERTDHSYALRSREKVVTTLCRAGIRFVALEDGILAVAKAEPSGS